MPYEIRVSFCKQKIVICFRIDFKGYIYQPEDSNCSLLEIMTFTLGEGGEERERVRVIMLNISKNVYCLNVQKILQLEPHY